MTVDKICKPFADLSGRELYDLLQLRSQVFVVEQNCVFLDPDGKDALCHHVLFYENVDLVAYARIVPAGISYPSASLGRIITSEAVRGTGVGTLLLQYSISALINIYGESTIEIGAQLYAKAFYEQFGFRVEGDIYDEDGIDHIHMRRP